MVKGTAFWRKDDDGEAEHLRFVISEPDIDNNVLIVHMTKWYNTGREDDSCVLMPGDHDCVKAKSWIKYDRSFEKNYIDLIRERHQGIIKLMKNLNPSILSRIQTGAQKSPALKLKFKKYFQFFYLKA